MSFPKQSEFEAEPAPGEKIDDPGEETLASSQLKFEPEQAFPEEIDEIDELTEEVEMPEEKYRFPASLMLNQDRPSMKRQWMERAERPMRTLLKRQRLQLK